MQGTLICTQYLHGIEEQHNKGNKTTNECYKNNSILIRNLDLIFVLHC